MVVAERRVRVAAVVRVLRRDAAVELVAEHEPVEAADHRETVTAEHATTQLEAEPHRLDDEVGCFAQALHLVYLIQPVVLGIRDVLDGVGVVAADPLVQPLAQQ